MWDGFFIRINYIYSVLFGDMNDDLIILFEVLVFKGFVIIKIIVFKGFYFGD